MKLLITISFLLSFSVAAHNPFSMEDLQALTKNQQWKELVPHLNDIKPSKRDAKWTSMVQSAMKGRFQQLLTEGQDDQTMIFLDKYLSLYTPLLKDKDFMSKRAEFGLNYYNDCFKYKDDSCKKQFIGFVALDPNKSIAFKAAKKVRLRISDLGAVEYFDSARPIKKFGKCDDQDLALAVYAGLTLKPGNDKLIKKAQALAFGTCQDALKATIKKAITSDKDGMANGCQLAVKNNSITGVAMKKCKAFLKGK